MLYTNIIKEYDFKLCEAKNCKNTTIDIHYCDYHIRLLQKQLIRKLYDMENKKLTEY